ncbi:hypothetical protein KC338_g9343 [Hortaea werneckii]|nr:hypothetical protein KC338_g9343 [Hortaea werneckii]KAI6857340.1 hypothetical protein KC323_g7448 [Hortaea werneckii]KAI7343482.1 hypothetical protein KC320_g9258 [Hortaea werneckii]
MFSRASFDFDSARWTLHHSDEVQEKGEKAIDSDVWIDALPFPDGFPPSLGCDHIKPSPGGPFELEAKRTTSDGQKPALGQSMHDGSPVLPTEKKILESGTNQSHPPGALGEPGVSPEAHQLVEDGRRTPPRRSSRRVSNDAYVSDSLHSDLSERRRLLQRDLFNAETLNLYCDAVRNLDFMREKAVGGYDHDPFLIKSSRALERGVLESSGLIPDHLLPKGDLPLPCDHEHPLLSNESGGRHYANRQTTKKQRLERFAMASFGGLLIIVPMLIMANVPGKIASLVTSCVAITIFAALITLVTKLGPHEVLASVAAYAAVLVVFVGLSLEKR